MAIVEEGKDNVSASRIDKSRNVSFVNIDKHRKSWQHFHGNRTSVDVRKPLGLTFNTNFTKYEKFMQSVKKSQNSFESPNMDAIKYYRSDSKDSKIEN
jgi:hypothetical protein